MTATLPSSSLVMMRRSVRHVTFVALVVVALLGSFGGMVDAEIRDLRVLLQPDSTLVHFSEGYLVAPGFIDLSLLKFITLGEPTEIWASQLANDDDIALILDDDSNVDIDDDYAIAAAQAEEEGNDISNYDNGGDDNYGVEESGNSSEEGEGDDDNVESFEGGGEIIEDFEGEVDLDEEEDGDDDGDGDGEEKVYDGDGDGDGDSSSGELPDDDGRRWGRRRR